MPTDGADRVAKAIEAIDRARSSDIDQPQPHATAVLQALRTPEICAPAIVLIAL